MKNRWIAMLLVLAMLFSMVPAVSEDGGETLGVAVQETVNEPAPAAEPAPAKAEEPVKAEEPAKAEEPVKAEEPAKAEEPVKAEEPAKAEEPVKTEEPVKAEEPAQAEEPAPAPVETPASDEAEPAAPVTGAEAEEEQPAAAEESAPAEEAQEEQPAEEEPAEEAQEEQPAEEEPAEEAQEEQPAEAEPAEEAQEEQHAEEEPAEQPEGSEPEEEQTIDYSKKASENPLFVRGYAKVDSGAMLYETEKAYEGYARISYGVVYALSRPNVNGKPDRLQIAFADEEGVHKAYVAASALRPMNENAVADFLKLDEAAQIETPHTYVAGNGAEYPLEVVKVTAEVKDEPAAEETDAEEPAVEPEDEHPEVPAAETEDEDPEEPAVEPADEDPEAPAAETEDEDPEEPAVEPEDEDPEVPAVEPEDETPEEPATEPEDETPEVPEQPEVGFEVEYNDTETVVSNKEGKRVELPDVRTEIGLGETIALAPVAYDGNNSVVSTAFTYASNNEAVATVTADGKVTGVSLGSAAITVQSINGASSVLVLEVRKAPAKVAINGGVALMGEGQSLQLTYTLDNGAAGAVEWKSSDAAVASVDAAGVVTANMSGAAVIQAITYNGLSANFALTVISEPEDIELNETEKELNETESFDLAASFSGDVKGVVEFTVEGDEGVVELEVTGDTTATVKALGSGTVTITATVKNSVKGTTYSKSCQVTVVPAVVSIELKGLRAEIGLKETVALMPVAYDARGNELPVTFKVASATTKSVTIKNGTSVYGAATGSSKVTVSAPNGVKVTVTIKVKNAPTSVSVSPKTATVSAGETLTLKAAPNSGSASAIRWTSSDETLATVDANGVVTALAEGKVTITALTFNNKKAACTVTILPALDEISFTEAEYTVIEALTAAAAINENAVATFSIADEYSAIASVDEKTGVITGLTSGEAVVTATVFNHITGREVTTTAKVSVIPGPARIEIGQTRTAIGVGETIDLMPQAYDRNGKAVEAPYTLATSSSANASVSGTKVKGVKAGKSTITVKAANGCYTTVAVTVVAAPSKVNLSSSKLTLIVGETASLTATVPTAGAITWKTLNPDCVAVDENGALTALTTGTATVRATAYNGKYANCTVTVQEAPVSIAFAESQYTVSEGATLTIPAVVSPAGAGGKVVYSVENVDVESVFTTATINETTGAVTGALSNDAIVTASLVNPVTGETLTASYTLHVVPAPVTVKFRNGRTTIGLKETVDLLPVAYDARGMEVDTNFTVSTSASKYVTVSGTTVYGKAAGSATITVKAENGVSAKLTVKTVAAPTKISVDPASIVLAAGSSAQAKVKFASGQAGAVDWFSSDESVAAVYAEDGTITALAEGEATITAKTFNGKTATCKVTVVPSVGEMAFEKEEYSVNTGASLQPKLTLGVAGVRADIVYSLTDDQEYEVATIDPATGAVKALAPGKATVKATVYDAELGKERTAECVINVAAVPASIKLATGSVTLGVGEVVYLRPEAFDSVGQPIETTFKYKSSNTSYVPLSGDKATAKAVGTSTITVTAANGISVSIKITVKKAPTSVSVSKSSVKLAEGETTTLTASVASGTAGAIAWSSADETIATVDEAGLVTAVKAGTVNITAKAYNGKSKPCAVTVIPAPQALAFTEEEYQVTVGATATVALATDVTNVKYVTADEDIIRVNETTGSVYGLRTGTATVTAEVYDYVTGSTVTGSAAIQVVAPALRLEAPKTNVLVGVKETVAVAIATIGPDGTDTGAPCTFKSSNAKIATVKNNTVTGVAAGKATITVETVGGARATFVVEVRKAPDKVSITGEGNKLGVGDTMALKANLPSGTASQLTWASSDETIAKVDANGNVTAIAKGTATISVKTFNNKSAKYSVTVCDAPIMIEFSEATYTVTAGKTLATVLNMTPADSYGKPVYEIASVGMESGIASVDASGKITGLRSGTATLIATVHDNVKNVDVKTFAVVVVMPAAVRVEFKETRRSIGVKETVDLVPVAYDADGEVVDTAITLKSSATKYVTVSGTAVYGKAAGSATVTATTANGVSAKVTIKTMTAPSKVTVSPSSATISETGSVQLKTTIASSQAGGVTWRSEDESVAVVNENGLVTAVATGSVKIIARTYNGKESGCTVTVVGEPEGISFVEENLSIGEGASYTVEAASNEGTIGKITYVSLNPFVATVDADTGRVTAVKQGTTQIMAVTINNKTKQVYSARCGITVTAAPVTLELKELRTSIGLNEVVTVVPVAYDSLGNEVKGEVTLKSSSTTYLKVSGMDMKGVKAGSATLTATAYNGVKATAKITVTAAPASVSVKPSPATVVIDSDPVQLIATPASKTASAITWTVEDSSIATVDEKGFVTGVAYGTTRVKATTYNGKSAYATINVFNPPESVTFAEDAFELGEGATKQLVATLNETAAGAIYYNSADEEIATVDENGVVTARKTGTTTIVATTFNGKRDICTITVTPAPVRIELIGLRTSIGLNEQVTIQAVSYDGNDEVVDGKLKLASSSTTYLKVSGMDMKGVKAGSATLTVTAYNGVKATAKITVTAAPASVSVKPSPATVIIGSDPVQLIATPASKTASAITWTVEDSSIATVDEKGFVTGVAYGTTRVKATTYNGKSAYATINVFNPPESVTLDQHKITLGVNDKKTLKATLNETAAGAITFTSSDKDIASVASDGTVVALGIGTATIMVETFNGKTDVCTVEVLPAPTFIELREKKVTIGVGQELDVTALVNLSNGSATTFKFVSAATATAKVSSAGIITGVKVGSTTVKVTTHNGLSCSLTVVVQKAATSISVKVQDPVVFLGETTTAIVTLGSNSMASWTLESSDPEICSVDEDGVTLHANSLGKAVITATTHTGVKGFANIEVAQHVEGITLNPTECGIVHYDSNVITATVLPENAYNKYVLWTSSAPEVVSVDATGKFTALQYTEEPVIITATTEDGGFTAQCIVHVEPVVVESISLTESAISVEKGFTHALTPVILPENADDQRITWTSSNPSVVSVDETGTVTALTNEGTATITATTVDGGFTAACVVTAVRVKPRKVTLNTPNCEMINLSTFQLSAAIEPETAEYRAINWFSDDEVVLTVDENGLVSAHKPGSANVTVTVEDYDGDVISATCIFVVHPIRVTGVTLDEEAVGLRVGKTATLTATIAPDDADNQAITWTSSAPAVVAVESNDDFTATLTATGVGTATVTVKTEDGNYTATCTVTVVDALRVNAAPNYEFNTLGNDIVWKISSPTAIGTPTYVISVTRDGETYTFRQEDDSVILPTPEAGDYTITVNVADETGDTATCTSTVNMASVQLFEDDGLTYSYRIVESYGETGAAISLVDKVTTKTTITVPKTANGVTIVRIDNEAFMGMVNLAKVNVPDTVNVIGARAFKGCATLSNLESYSAK